MLVFCFFDGLRFVREVYIVIIFVFRLVELDFRVAFNVCYLEGVIAVEVVY